VTTFPRITDYERIGNDLANRFSTLQGADQAQAIICARQAGRGRVEDGAGRCDENQAIAAGEAAAT
jgi:hypothetical protein